MLLLLLLPFVYSQVTRLKENALISLPMVYEGSQLSTSVVIDANWRWSRYKDNYENCFTDKWESKFCPDPVTCSKNCIVEGAGSVADYLSTYGVSSSGKALTLRYLTKHQYGTNIGSRMYMLAPDGKNYQGFNLLNREFVFTADMSEIECGMNGAIYFVELPLDGNVKLNGAGSAYGMAYGDAQMPKDIKYIDSWVNMNNSGPASCEYDVWEANKYANAFTAHTCKYPGVKACTSDIDCGVGKYRHKGWADKDGADMNLFRNDPIANKFLYGPGKQYKVDTSRPFQVITQFITSDGTDKGDLVQIKRMYKQDGKLVEGGTQTDEIIAKQKVKFSEPNHFAELGGLKAMGDSFRRKMTLAISLWDDSSVSMLWLDSRYPINGNNPGDLRGPCSGNGQDPGTLRSKYSSAKVVYSDFQVNKLASPSPVPSPTPSPVPSPTPSPVPSPVPCEPVPASIVKGFTCSCLLQ